MKDNVELVWQNCILYNSRPADQPTRDLCNDVQRHFEKLWTEAGLTLATKPQKNSPSPKKAPVTIFEVSEAEVPEQYNLPAGAYHIEWKWEQHIEGTAKRHHLQKVALQELVKCQRG